MNMLHKLLHMLLSKNSNIVIYQCFMCGLNRDLSDCLSAIILNLLDYYQYLAGIAKNIIPHNIPRQRFVSLLLQLIIWKIAKASGT